jgi:ADP-ribose pyrophosphatase YjhB (NUDIX family)
MNVPTAAEIESPKYRISSLAVDNVIFVDLRSTEDVLAFQGWHDEYPDKRGPDPVSIGLHVLLIVRKNPPFEGCLCLPGGFNDYGEDPNDAAPRELREETHLSPDVLPKQKLIGVYGKKDRDPRRHVITIAYGCQLAPHLARAAYGGDDAKETWLVSLADIVSKKVTLGFDHLQIVLDAFDKVILRKR